MSLILGSFFPFVVARAKAIRTITPVNTSDHLWQAENRQGPWPGMTPLTSGQLGRNLRRHALSWVERPGWER